VHTVNSNDHVLAPGTNDARIVHLARIAHGVSLTDDFGYLTVRIEVATAPRADAEGAHCDAAGLAGYDVVLNVQGRPGLDDDRLRELLRSLGGDVFDLPDTVRQLFPRALYRLSSSLS